MLDYSSPACYLIAKSKKYCFSLKLVPFQKKMLKYLMFNRSRGFHIYVCSLFRQRIAPCKLSQGEMFIVSTFSSHAIILKIIKRKYIWWRKKHASQYKVFEIDLTQAFDESGLVELLRRATSVYLSFVQLCPTHVKAHETAKIESK